jgi:hypothetical protein
MSDSRAELEAWEKSRGGNITRHESGLYANSTMQGRWTVWQAARKAALAEAAQHLEKLNDAAKGQHNYFKFAANELRSLADRSPT